MDQIVNDITSQVLQIVALAALLGLSTLRKKTAAYLASRLNAKQMEVLHMLAKEAYAFAETAYVTYGGHEKLSLALNYVEQHAKARSIPFDAAQAKAAIEKAWLESEGIAKRFAPPLSVIHEVAPSVNDAPAQTAS